MINDYPILVPSTHTRFKSFLAEDCMISCMNNTNGLTADQRDQVEILYLVDNKKVMLSRSALTLMSC